MNTEMGERVRARRDQLGMSQGRLAELVGCSQPMIKKIEAGSRTSLGRKLADALGTTLEWLETGIKRDASSTDVQQGGELYSPPPLDSIDVPLFDTRASMGPGFIQPEHETVVERISVATSWVREALPSISSAKNLALLPAFGDSMEGTFNDGDLLWVDRGVTEVKTDAVYVLALQDDLYVKRLQRRPDGNILMISDNKKYESYLITDNDRDRFRVLGRVVYAWRGSRL